MSATTPAPKPTASATAPGATGTSSSGSTSSSAASPATRSSATGGTTTIADGVVSKIAGIAARGVSGVHDLGGAGGRAVGAIRNRLNQSDPSQGVSVEVGETQVAADVTLVAEYPVDLQQVADDVRSAITDAIERYVGRDVTEVNITIADVVIPTDDDSSGAQSS